MLQGNSIAATHDAPLFARVMRLVAQDGAAAHPHIATLIDGRTPDSSRNLSDAIHFICLLHGRHPGVPDHAAWRAQTDHGRDGLELLAGWFDRERALLTRLVVAVGPLPSTPAQMNSESAVLAQRNALTMLAKSDRPGCALGASLALVADWNGIRPVLDLVAERWLVPNGGHLAVETQAESLVAPLEGTPAERAVMFGASQVLAQHRCLWDLLDARARARAQVGLGAA